MKNPHQPNTVLWQLYENIKGYENKATAYIKDAERYTKFAQEARESAGEYQAAYDILKGALAEREPC